MAESYGFFNSATGDVREYTQDHYADFFKNFFNNGISHVNGNAGLKVNAGLGLDVVMEPGYAIINGFFYKNDSALNIPIDAADLNFSRIDRIVLRLDLSNRTIKSFVKKGTATSNPVPPVLQRDGTIYELSLAWVKINASGTNVTVIDERGNEDVCGFVSVAADVPIQEMWNSFEQQWNLMRANWEDWFEHRQTDINPRFYHQLDQPESVVGDIWVQFL